MEPTSNSFSGAWVVAITIVLAGIGGGIFYVSTKPEAQQAQVIAGSSTETHNDNMVATSTEVEDSQTNSSTQEAGLPQSTSTSASQQVPAKSSEVKAATVSSHADWAKLTSYQGFSLQYPYKQMGAGWGDEPRLGFFVSGGALNKGATTTEEINNMINNLHLYVGLGISVTSATTTVENFDTWLQDYRKNHPSRVGYQHKLTSEQKTKATVGGLNGYLFTLTAEPQNSKTAPRYIQKDIFVRDASNVYHFSYETASPDTALSSDVRLSKLFSEYFTTVNTLSEQVIKTIKFDGSKIASITVPKTSAPKPTGEAAVRRQKLLAALRSAPYFDNSATYPKWSSGTRCSDGSTTTGTEGSSGGGMTLAPGLYVGVSNVMYSPNSKDEIADVHGYDEQGWHTGPMPRIPDFGYSAPIEEFAKQIHSVDLGPNKNGLSIRDNINGKIVIEGKKYGLGVLELSGDGNSCVVAELFIPLTPYSVATIPMTKAGDLGPISYDIDGDGVEDFQISLLHPMTLQKVGELNALLVDMQSGIAESERSLYTPFFE